MIETANKGVKLLKYWLDGEHLTQKSLCAIVDITPQHMSRLIKGTFVPSLSLAVRMEEVCSIPCRAWLERV